MGQAAHCCSCPMRAARRHKADPFLGRRYAPGIRDLTIALECATYVHFPRLHLSTPTFKPEHSSPGLQVYLSAAGRLWRPRSWLQGGFQFREVLGARHIIAGIRHYAPVLPWYPYMVTQTPTRLLVMRIYQRHLARLARLSHRLPTARPDTLAVTVRTRCGRLDVVSATPSPPSAACAPPQRRLEPLATENGDISGLARKSHRWDRNRPLFVA